MKKRQNKNRIIVWTSIAALIGLLCLLSFVERSAPNSTIKTPWDAFWYFIVTVTTVGYGDMKPITLFGQLLGLFFILLSCGLISVVLTATLRFLTGSHILYLRIRNARAEKWYIFDGTRPQNRCLARKLDKLPENAGIIFCETERQNHDFLSFRHIYTPLTVREVTDACIRTQKKTAGGSSKVFLTSDDEENNLKTALEILSSGCKADVYCRSTVRFDAAPDGLHTFDYADLTARTYWADHPLTSGEKNVVLIGSGFLLDDLIEQALLVNTFGPLLRCRYHVFEEADTAPGAAPLRESGSFLKDHPRIADVVTVVRGADACAEYAAALSGAEAHGSQPDGQAAAAGGSQCDGQADSAMHGSQRIEGAPAAGTCVPDNDVLLFHAGSWNDDHDCLACADRIILCTSSGIDNIRIAEKIRLLVPTQAQLHICGSGSIDGATGFGDLIGIYTPELILREDLVRRARALNDYYNGMQADASKRTAWEDLDKFTRRSNIAATDHMGTKLRILTGNLANARPVTADEAALRLAMKNFSEGIIDRNLCRRIEHERWMRFHSLYGWTYGAVRDNARRRHPMMVPFEELTPKEQALDDISWELLSTLASF